MEHLKVVSLVYTLALLTKIGLGWKDLAVANTLAYYKTLKMTDVIMNICKLWL